MSAHLKSITISGFKGDSDEMEAAKYLLEKGKVLNKVTIYAGDLLCRREELDKELELIQRGSRTCRVEFFWDAISSFCNNCIEKSNSGF